MSGHDDFAESLFKTCSKKCQHSVEKCKSNNSVLQVKCSVSLLFCRIGLQGDVSDPRTKSFLYILDILPRYKLTSTSTLKPLVLLSSYFVL